MLEGIKVLSFTHFLQGPSAVQILADLGADVIKVEPPKGAWERHWSGYNAFVNGVSIFYAAGNRNQRSISVDIRTDRGRQIIASLIQKSDVLVENFRPGVLERLGFGYNDVSAKNPRIIYASLSGYGSTGPYRDRPGQDLLLQAFSGLCSATGSCDTPPTPAGTHVADQHGAVLGALGILAALFERGRTGIGKRIDSNLLNAALDLQAEPLAYHLNKGSLWERSHTGIATRYHQAPYGVYQTSDGWLAISHASIDTLKMAFQDERLNAFMEADEFANREKVNGLIAQLVLQRSSEEWEAIFDTYGIWYASVNDYETVIKDQQVQWNQMIISVKHPDAGELRLLNHPVRYNGAPPKTKHESPPRLGEHTKQILSELGFSEESIESLIKDAVVVINETSSKGVL